MRAALVYPEYYEIAHFQQRRKEMPPFGVLYLAAVLEEEGFEVKLFKATDENCIYDFCEYDLIGLSLSSSVTYSIMKKVCQNSKFSCDSLKIAGGIHASLYPKVVMQELGVQIVSIGEGEETLRELARYIKSGRREKLINIRGIYYNDAGKIKYTGIRKKIEDLDTIPFPARHLLDEEDFVMTNRLSNTNYKMTHILCSRGCPYECNFCANQERGIRYRSGENIQRELAELVSKYEIEGFCIVDDNFIVDKDNLKGILREIAPMNLKWSALSRVNTVDNELLESLRESGCIEIKYGIESGSQRILEAMNKKISIEQIKKAVNLTYDMGIKVKAFILHGFPGENMESTNETIQLLEELGDKIERVSMFSFAPLPGSPVYEKHEEFGIKLPQSTDEIYIYNNSGKWWGNKVQQEELRDAYMKLKQYIESKWEKR